jgi:hypothetical protein
MIEQGMQLSSGIILGFANIYGIISFRAVFLQPVSFEIIGLARTVVQRCRKSTFSTSLETP